MVGEGENRDKVFHFHLCRRNPLLSTLKSRFHCTEHSLDVLMRHACGAKATTEWTWETAPHDDEHPQLSYRVCAARALQAGEELTVDLRTLAWRGLRGVRRRVSEGERASGVSLPAPAVGALGFECQCCGRPVFR